MTTDHVTPAVVGFLSHLKARGELSSRPLRLDGFSAAEVDRLLDPVMKLVAPGRVRVLDPLNNERAFRINAERATRYRNEVDVASRRDGFVLFIPLGQVVESSLDEPAFHVITRGNLFLAMLGELKSTLQLSNQDIEAIRETSRYRHPESIYGFLVSWDQQTGMVDPFASASFLGLLADSALGGSIEAIQARLRNNWRATEILLQPGVSPGRTLDALAAGIGVDSEESGPAIRDLLRWWQGGMHTPPPPAYDFKNWVVVLVDGPEIRWEPDLSIAPHRGWIDKDGRIEAESATASATLEWVATRLVPDTVFELQLIEENSQRVIARIGKTKSSRRTIKWTGLLKGDDLRAELRELNPAGDEEGYLFRVRMSVWLGKRLYSEHMSKPFTVQIGDQTDTVAIEPASTAYHALYRFHAEQRAAGPELVDPADVDPPDPFKARLRSSDDRLKDVSLDVSQAILNFESDLLSQPDVAGPWVAIHQQAKSGIDELRAVPANRVHFAPSEAWTQFAHSRADVFSQLVAFGSVEAADLRAPRLREAINRYVSTYADLIAELNGHVSRVGGVAADADRIRAAAILSIDSIRIRVEAQESDVESELLLVSPTHPAVLAWMLALGDTLYAWSRGRFDPAVKPLYRGLVGQLTAGPRSMVWATPRSDGTVGWWGFAGNLTAAWQCYFPLGAGAYIRSLNWEHALTRAVGLSARPIGAGALDARRIGTRLKKYAVLHPYVEHLRMAAVMSGDGQPLLDSLKVIDEKANTPAGAQSVREIRYELTLLGPRSPNLGRSIDAMTMNPGDSRWKRYASAIMDNPETLLAPGFAFARRPISAAGPNDLWTGITSELASFAGDGLHVLLLGPMLTASVGSASMNADEIAIDQVGLTARPVTTELPAFERTPYVGNWLLRLGRPGNDTGGLTQQALNAVAKATNLAFGTSDHTQQVGLQVALAGPMSDNLKRAHEIADWVIVADPLFSIEQMDRRQTAADESLLLDFTPEFDPYPGGRVVVTTNSLRELEAITGPVGRALAAKGALTATLASISARLLLNLSNPTKQVVNGLAGLALTRAYIQEQTPNALVIPIDGHEDMFVIRRAGRDAKLSDLLVLTIRDGRASFEVVESKWVGKQNLDKKVSDAVAQTRTTAEVIRSEYVGYEGVERQLRLDNLRRIVQFHLARCARHEISVGFSIDEAIGAITDPTFRQADVATTAVVWTPDAAIGSDQHTERDGVKIRLFGDSDIERYGRFMSSWLGFDDGAKGDSTTAEALVTLGSETIADDLIERREQEEAEADDGAPNGDARQKPPATSPAAAPAPDARANRERGFDEETFTGEIERARASGGLTQPLDPRRGLDPCVRLGSIVGSERPAVWCPPDLSNGHLILVGGSGAGKTTALRHITEQIRERGLPVLVLDFHGDITSVDHDERVYTFDYEGNAAFVNPFHLEPSYGSKLTPTRLKWEFVEAWQSHYPAMGVHQINFLAELIEESYASAVITDDPASWRSQITFANVLEAFEDSPAPENVKIKIRSYMKRYREWRIFHGSTEIAVERLLEESTRLDLSQLDETARNILADVVLRRLFLIVRALGPLDPALTGWKKFRTYVVIDEAQILMGGGSDAKASLSKYAAEARKFGIGLILATQLRDNVPTEIWGNIDTRLFMQALDPTERARNAKAANVPEMTLQSLARGQAILTSSSQPNQRPLTVQIKPSWMDRS
jgi:hypothetical protein